MYQIELVDGVTHQDTLERFNARVHDWPPLTPRHLTDGHWWLALHDDVPIAFAGMVPFEPFPNVGYLKRCYVAPDHLGHGLQYRLMVARELKAKQLGWTHLVSECLETNLFSANNFRRAGFSVTDPEQKWGAANSVYWVKSLCH